MAYFHDSKEAVVAVEEGASPWESCSWELSEVFDGEELEGVGVVPSSCDLEGVGLEEV